MTPDTLPPPFPEPPRIKARKVLIGVGTGVLLLFAALVIGGWFLFAQWKADQLQTITHEPLTGSTSSTTTGDMTATVVVHPRGTFTVIDIARLRLILPDEFRISTVSSEPVVIMGQPGWSGGPPTPGFDELQHHTLGSVCTFYYRGREWRFENGIIAFDGESLDLANDEAVILIDPGASTGKILRKGQP